MTSSSSLSAGKAALLLFGSGFCALIYQIAWQREFRLIFGVSTAATAAVLAIFAGGLGIGSALFGRAADRTTRPLRLYAMLEVGVAVLVCLTPFLLDAVRVVYFRLGGSPALGSMGATVSRLLLSALVLAGPTMLMGGTLPAMARAIKSSSDPGRRTLGVLYGVNTLGAVAGILISTFWLLEHFGVRMTLWAAAAINLMVALVAWNISHHSRSAVASTDPMGKPAPQPQKDLPDRSRAGKSRKRDTTPGQSTITTEEVPAWFVLTAAGLVGFVFFLMEMVWYRMLAPLLGGSVYTFGIILAVALLGIAAGSLLYSMWHVRRSAIEVFALTCLLEGVALIIPFALGDRIALQALYARENAADFYDLIRGWLFIVALTALPAATVAGFQFPLLVALLGKGNDQLGGQVGKAYAVNTAGAIGGSLTGGFLLMPILGATGCWIIAALILTALGLIAALSSESDIPPARKLALPLALAAVTLAMVFSTGPTVAWRHSAIGAGIEIAPVGKNEARDFILRKHRTIQWQQDGLESSIALETWSGNALVVNGKIDGNVVHDAATTVMAGILGPLLKPHATTALIIGLGVGSTAGWMASLPQMEKVEVVELEPAVLDVAKACAAGTENALQNKKVSVRIGDARELLLVDRQAYDIIFSEPSNPYRAGIASLYTREYYEAARKRLNADGLFLQWVQSYQVGTDTVRTIYATLHSVFPQIETWQLKSNDLLLVASMEPIRYDAEALRARLREPAFRRPQQIAWKSHDLESLLSHFLAGPELARQYARLAGTRLNTDDQTLIEFECARVVSDQDSFAVSDIRKDARIYQCEKPQLDKDTVQWDQVLDGQSLLYTANGLPPSSDLPLTSEQQYRVTAQRTWLQHDLEATLKAWKKQPRAPETILERAMVGIALAEAGDAACLQQATALETIQPGDAHAIAGRYYFKAGRIADATSETVAAFHSYRQNPWATDQLIQTALNTSAQVAQNHKEYAAILFEAVKDPFALHVQNENRLDAVVVIAHQLDPAFAAKEAWEPIEPNVRWQLPFLQMRAEVYRKAGDPMSAKAAAELAEFIEHHPVDPLPAGEIIPSAPPVPKVEWKR